MKYSSEELNERFDNLPEDLKNAFLSVDTAHVINSIGRKYGLYIDKIGETAEETGLVLLGLTHPTEFVSNLTKRLGIDRVVASQIASEINDQVFLKVRELLKDVQREKIKKEEEIELEPRPSKDALLAALEHPEGMLKRPVSKPGEIPLVEVKNPYAPAKPTPGVDVPIVAPVPASAYEEKQSMPPAENPPAQDILTQKMSGQFSMPKAESVVDQNTSTPTKRFDPYKEQV